MNIFEFIFWTLLLLGGFVGCTAGLIVDIVNYIEHRRRHYSLQAGFDLLTMLLCFLGFILHCIAFFGTNN